MINEKINTISEKNNTNSSILKIGQSKIKVVKPGFNEDEIKQCID